MKKTVWIIALMALGLIAKAQIVSLNNGEIKRLKNKISNNEAYQKLYDHYKTLAAQALTETPDPIDLIQSQGLLEGNPLKVATNKSIRDFPKVYALAVNYRISGQKADLDKATEFLLAWAKTNHSAGDPINDTKLEDAITAYDLIRNAVSAANRNAIDLWLEQTAQAEVNSKSAVGNRGTAINNWNSHRIKIITLIAYTLHDKKYDSVISSLLEKQLDINLNNDGTTWDFVERDAFHYHTYDLEPLLSAITAIDRATGKNYFIYQTSKGASIQKSVDFMVPYMTGEKQHGEFTNSHVKFDQDRAKNGEKGYAAGTPFNPKSGMFTLALAAYFNPDYVKVMKQVANDQQYFDWQLALNNVKDKANP